MIQKKKLQGFYSKLEFGEHEFNLENASGENFDLFQIKVVCEVSLIIWTIASSSERSYS